MIRESSSEQDYKSLRPTDRSRPTDEKQKALSVGLDLSAGGSFFVAKSNEEEYAFQKNI
jgi:hypothetical protein